VPSFLSDPSRWNEFIREEGDAEFGGALKALARTMPWFVRGDVREGVRSIVGQRMADAGRKLLAFPEYAAQRVADSAASYVRDGPHCLRAGASFAASATRSPKSRNASMRSRAAWKRSLPRMRPIRKAASPKQ